MSNNDTFVVTAVTSSGMAAITTDDVLRWIYLGLAIVSLLIPIVTKIIDALKDGKVTKEEAEDIKKAVDDAKDKVDDLREGK